MSQPKCCMKLRNTSPKEERGGGGVSAPLGATSPLKLWVGIVDVKLSLWTINGIYLSAPEIFLWAGSHGFDLALLRGGDDGFCEEHRRHFHTQDCCGS